MSQKEPEMLIAKEFTFDCAHKLPNYKGLCANLHGHTYKMIICLKGEIKKDGMVIDFSVLKQKVNDKVIKLIDHKFLNDIIDYPTAENIVVWIWDRLIKELPELHEISLWETPTSHVVYRGN